MASDWDGKYAGFESPEEEPRREMITNIILWLIFVGCIVGIILLASV